jgi:sarcosine oxidase subunit beta
MPLYDFCVRRWEQWPEELGPEILFDQRGLLTLAHSQAEVAAGQRVVFANRMAGIDAEWVERDDLPRLCPILDISDAPRYPVFGAALQPRGGIARHDAVMFHLARACDAMGVHLLQGCEVTGFLRDGARVTGVRTSRGDIGAARVGLVAAGRTPLLARLAGIEVPVQSYPLQALVSDIHEPFLPCVALSGRLHMYVSQAHKGELVMGAARDPYRSYAQRGSSHILEQQLQAALELYPIMARAHLLRVWAGIVDVTPDAAPIIGATPLDGLFLNCGWGTGGFKATPGSGVVFAHALATGTPHPLAVPFGLQRFTTGALVDEHGAAGVAH